MESESKTSDVILKGKWQWKSNLDPWSKTEESRWEFYTLEQNYLIEKAYDDKKKTEVDIGEYIVSIQHMRQSKKGNITSQRPIRRITCENDEPDVRSERYFETELPKTINKIFGSLEHFIIFFSRRNPEILDFTKQFNEFQQSNDLIGFNHNIIPKLINCLHEELLRPIEDQLKNHLVSDMEKKTLMRKKVRHEALIPLLNKEFESFEEFYGLIIRSYTMSTDLYLNLNKYLRNESWTAVDNLLPYVICLCKAFFSLKLSKNSEEENKVKTTESSIIFYRGTALDEFALSSYRTKEVSKLFAWNSVTSTSRRKEIAEKFMYESVDMKNKKYPVLFLIEIPLANVTIKSEDFKWIDIHQYSAMPTEDEVILAPGSAFELVSFSTDEEKRTTIQVKLKHEVESLAHGGLIMQGAFQSKMIRDKQVKIVCLEGEELSEALKSIAGNRLFEEIEFCLCNFDMKTLGEMLHVLPTLEKARRLKFVSCKYDNKQETSGFRLQNMKDCKILEIKICEVQDFFNILSFNNPNENFWASSTNLMINFKNCESDYRKFQLLKFPTQLTSLTLDFSWSEQLRSEGVNNLAYQGLKNLTQLTSLDLNFSWCFQMTDEAINNLASQGLKYLIQLTSLTLNFLNCEQITNQGVTDLASQALRNLTQLTSLNLCFAMCKKITDEGASNLASQGLKYLTRLTSLTLNFSSCGLTTEGHESLKQFTSSIQQVTILTQTFKPQKIISYQDREFGNGMLDLDLTRPKNLDKQKLFVNHSQKSTLSENPNSKIPATSSESPEELERTLSKYLLQLINPHWAAKTLLTCAPSCQVVSMERNIGQKTTDLCITSLQVKFKGDKSSLTGRLSGSEQISNEEVKSPVFQGLKCLTQLISLTLDFSWYNEITNEELTRLASQLLKHLTQLTSLTLNFSKCRQITDEGVNNLACQGLQDLTQLTSLVLNFSRCDQITDEGMNNLASSGLRNLTQLTSLTLNFGDCRQITSKGVTDLASQALSNFTQLTSLALDFSWCKKIIDEAMNNLAFYGLKYLSQLTSLTLNFSDCGQITSQGVTDLVSQALRNLIQLISLNLRFSMCKKITDEGVNNLISHIIKDLTQLTALKLVFLDCGITVSTISSISEMLHYYGFSSKNSHYSKASQNRLDFSKSSQNSAFAQQHSGLDSHSNKFVSNNFSQENHFSSSTNRLPIQEPSENSSIQSKKYLQALQGI